MLKWYFWFHWTDQRFPNPLLLHSSNINCNVCLLCSLKHCKQNWILKSLVIFKLFNFSSSKVYDKTYKTDYLFLVFIRTKYKICSVFCSVLRRSYRLCLYMIYKQSYKKSSRKIKCLIKFCFNYCRIVYYAYILLEIHNLNVLVVVELGGGGHF